MPVLVIHENGREFQLQQFGDLGEYLGKQFPTEYCGAVGSPKYSMLVPAERLVPVKNPSYYVVNVTLRMDPHFLERFGIGLLGMGVPHCLLPDHTDHGGGGGGGSSHGFVSDPFLEFLPKSPNDKIYG